MRQAPNVDAAYPVPERVLVVADMEITIPRPELATGRISDFLVERYGLDEDGRLNVALIDDPFMLDVFRMSREASEAIAVIGGIAQGAFQPHGVEADANGSHLFTDREAAANALKTINTPRI